ncbi:Mitochondrial distribution and morphology protein 10 [Saccharomyces pastorianus]|uniref:Mitochondrial distribution and morphology protein 10 n=1 Tax=Saccharomyces pastorianus TaxID=27292 RepID=A0A6C1DML8_SACPS|nr:Mitochondrial distribution and morphology protein 10 [Saccharomyces pastorianus]
MDQVLRAFYQSTHWSTQNSYEDITATSRTLLDFRIPSAIHLQISNKSTPNTFNSLDFSTRSRINGSLSYLYSDAQQLEKFMRNSTDIPLQDATETYRQLQPNLNFSVSSGNTLSSDNTTVDNDKKLLHDSKFVKKSLYYGRMYYPSSDLEAMIIKRLSPQTQFMLKGVSSFKESLNVLTCYFQRDSHRNLQEWIFSTSDLLCGYRVLHNFLTTPSKFNTSLYNNSSLSLGAEFWLGLVSLSPGCSTTLRYYTHSTNTGRPLTLTLSWNPLFGHISSTYSAKTGTNSTFCAKYDFNLYSIESNLSFGATKLLHENVPDLNSAVNDIPSTLDIPVHKQKLLNDLTYAFSSSLRKIDEERSTIEKFDNKINSSIFTSVWKLSTSLRDKTLKLLWEGKWRGFLISAGTELVFTRGFQESLSDDEKNDNAISISATDTENGNIPVFPAKFGIQFQYST